MRLLRKTILIVGGSMKTLIWVLAVIALFAPPLAAQPYHVGDPVGDFTLLDSDGNPVSLSDYPDQIVFLVFWESG